MSMKESFIKRVKLLGTVDTRLYRYKWRYWLNGEEIRRIRIDELWKLALINPPTWEIVWRRLY